MLSAAAPAMRLSLRQGVRALRTPQMANQMRQASSRVQIATFRAAPALRPFTSATSGRRDYHSSMTLLDEGKEETQKKEEVSDGEAAGADEAKKEERKKRKEKKKKKKKAKEEEIVEEKKTKSAPTVNPDDHLKVSNEEVTTKLREMLEEAGKLSWLQRITRGRLVANYVRNGGVAHEYLRQNGLTNLDTHKYEILRVMHLYAPLAHQVLGRKDWREMTNQEWKDAKLNTLTRMTASQRFYEVFPDVVDKFTPLINMVVEYDTKESGRVPAIRGNEIPPFIAKEEPTIRFTGQSGHFYTIVMINPDAPAHVQPDMRELQHWVVGNIPSDGEVRKGDVLTEYLGPVPAKGTEFHRYVYLLLDQGTQQVEFNEPKLKNGSLDGRPGFNTREFIAKYGLRPRGLAFFVAEWESHVTQAYEQLGMKEPIFVNERTKRVMDKKSGQFVSSRYSTWKTDLEE